MMLFFIEAWSIECIKPGNTLSAICWTCSEGIECQLWRLVLTETCLQLHLETGLDGTLPTAALKAITRQTQVCRGVNKATPIHSPLEGKHVALGRQVFEH